MKLINRIVLVGLIMSGLALIIGLSGAMPEQITARLFAISTVSGWLFAAIAIVAFSVVTIVHLMRPFPSFWLSLFPINLGLSILGVAFLGFRVEDICLWGISILCGILLAGILFACRTTRWRVLPVFLVIPIFALSFDIRLLNHTVVQVTISSVLIGLVLVSKYVDKGCEATPPR